MYQAERMAVEFVSPSRGHNGNGNVNVQNTNVGGNVGGNGGGNGAVQLQLAVAANPVVVTI